MITVNGIQILCGATAEQAANEEAGQGFFTAALVQALSTPHDPPLLTLPLDLGDWLHALPVELLGPGVTILQDRAALVGPVPQQRDMLDHDTGPARAPSQEPLTPPLEDDTDGDDLRPRDMLDEDTGPARPRDQRAEAV
jgi:hypothetical protein